MGETRVDLHHLLEDLRDAYPGSIEETILTEIVANSLDSGAAHITLAADPAQATLTVADDGSGMQRKDLARYHDIAASTKTRGQVIGFAGVGIKLGLLVCEEVLTETRRASTHVASRWRLASRHKAQWKWVTPEIAALNGLPSTYGAYLSEVVDGGPAARAGLRAGDILTSLDGVSFDEQHLFLNLLLDHKAGDQVQFHFLRQGESGDVTVTLGSRPAA